MQNLEQLQYHNFQNPLEKILEIIKNIVLRLYVSFKEDPGQEFHTAFINVANGIEKKTPQKPNILPKIKTARIIRQLNT